MRPAVALRLHSSIVTITIHIPFSTITIINITSMIVTIITTGLLRANQADLEIVELVPVLRSSLFLLHVSLHS